jgi:hypothetical protein
MLQAGRLLVRVPMIFFNLPNPSSRTMALEFTHPLTKNEYKMIFLESKARLAFKPNNLTAIYEPTA